MSPLYEIEMYSAAIHCNYLHIRVQLLAIPYNHYVYAHNAHLIDALREFDIRAECFKHQLYNYDGQCQFMHNFAATSIHHACLRMECTMLRIELCAEPHLLVA